MEKGRDSVAEGGRPSQEGKRYKTTLYVRRQLSVITRRSLPGDYHRLLKLTTQFRCELVVHECGVRKGSRGVSYGLALSAKSIDLVKDT